MTQMADFIGQKVDIEITAGDTLDMLVPLTDASGEDADLSDYTATSFAIGATTSTSTTLTVSKIGSSVRLQLTSAQVDGLDEFSEYDLQLTSSSVVRTPIYGVIKTQKQITT